MQRSGPLVTLLVGLATAVALLALTMRLTPNEATPQGTATSPVPSATSPAPSATTAVPETSSPPTPTSTKPATGRATYAGRIGRGASIALAVHDGRAIAYV